MSFEERREVRGRECGGEWGAGDFEEEDGEGFEGRGGEERGGEVGLGGGEEVSEALEDGHLVDEFVDEGDVERRGEADAGEDGVADGGGFWDHVWLWCCGWRWWRCGGCHFGEIRVFGRMRVIKTGGGKF